MLQPTFACKKLRPIKIGKYVLTFLSIFIFNIFGPVALFSQSLLLEKSTLSFDALNEEQTERLDHLQSQGIYSDYTLMEVHLSALKDDAGLVYTSLDNFFDVMDFKSFLVNYENDDNFSWSGKFFSPTDTLEYNDGALTLWQRKVSYRVSCNPKTGVSRLLTFQEGFMYWQSLMQVYMTRNDVRAQWFCSCSHTRFIE